MVAAYFGIKPKAKDAPEQDVEELLRMFPLPPQAAMQQAAMQPPVMPESQHLPTQ